MARLRVVREHVEHLGQLALTGQDIVSAKRPEAISRFNAAPTASNRGVRSALPRRSSDIPPPTQRKPLDKRYTLGP